MLHLSPDAPSSLAEILDQGGGPGASFATHGERIASSRIYVAPPDHHMLLSDGVVRLTMGPRENLARPAIDPLFRSAAQSYGNRVIAVLLSGLLDDGLQGVRMVCGRGGVVIVLEPEDAAFPQMPENAIKYDHPTYVLEASDISSVLRQLVSRPEKGFEKGLNSSDGQKTLQVQPGYVCPDCGGALFEERSEDPPPFRCRVRHAYSIKALLADNNAALESAFRAAVRALEENSELKQRTAAIVERSVSTKNAARLRSDAHARMEQAKLLSDKMIEASRRH